jgi:Mn2+/Fe2+ NRAMP family transporter
MTSLIRMLFFWTLALCAIVVAVANRHPVQFSLDPFNAAAPAIVASLPLYGIIMASGLIGLVLGGWSTWLGQSHVRQALREAEEKIRRLERENEVAQKLIVKPTGRAVQVR